MPILLVVLVTVPAVIIAAVAIFTGLDELPASGSQYVAGVALLTALFVASQAPQAVSRDLRHRTISLYLSRPLGRGQYVLAKASALVAATFTFLVLPVTVLHVGGLLAKLSVRDQLTGWLGGIWTAALYAVLLGLLALAICAWIVRRGFGVAAVVITLFLSVVVAGILASIIAYDAQNTGHARAHRRDPGPGVRAAEPHRRAAELDPGRPRGRLDDPGNRCARDGLRDRLRRHGGAVGACVWSGATARCRCHERPGAGSGLAVVRQRRRRQRRVDDPRARASPVCWVRTAPASRRSST